MTGGFGFRRAFENHENEAEHVERGESGNNYAKGEKSISRPCLGLGQGLSQNTILAEETAERPNTRQRQRAEEERPEGNRHLLPQPTHFPDILLVMQREDDGAGAQEEQRLEESVGG